MSLTITSTWIKEIAGVSTSDYDSLITSLITRWEPVIEHRIEDGHLATSDTDLRATIDLAANEIVAGELLAIIRREPGGSETVVLGEVEIRPWLGKDPLDPFGLKRSGWSRLDPYLKQVGELSSPGSSGVASLGEPEEAS